jgi:hypothetical protein
MRKKKSQNQSGSVTKALVLRFGLLPFDAGFGCLTLCPARQAATRMDQRHIWPAALTENDNVPLTA